MSEESSLTEESVVEDVAPDQETDPVIAGFIKTAVDDGPHRRVFLNTNHSFRLLKI